MIEVRKTNPKVEGKGGKGGGGGGSREEGMEKGMERIEVKAEGKRNEKNKNDEVNRVGEWEKALQKGAR